MRSGLVLILIGVFVALSGLFLSTGYDPNDGLLASLPNMGIEATRGTARASFIRLAEKPAGEVRLISFERPSGVPPLIQMPHPMDDYEVAKVLKAFDEQYPDGNSQPMYFQFDGWKTVVKREFWLPFALMLVAASALILIGVGLIVLGRRGSAKGSANL